MCDLVKKKELFRKKLINIKKVKKWNDVKFLRIFINDLFFSLLQDCINNTMQKIIIQYKNVKNFSN